MRLKTSAPVRGAKDVKEGDYVKIGSQWKQIASNTAFGEERTPRHWTVRTTDGASYDMFGINRYALADDLEP